MWRLWCYTITKERMFVEREGVSCRKQKKTGQEIRKGDTLESADYIKHCLTEIQAIILRNDEIFAKKVLMRVINLEKTIHK